MVEVEVVAVAVVVVDKLQQRAELCRQGFRAQASFRYIGIRTYNDLDPTPSLTALSLFIDCLSLPKG